MNVALRTPTMTREEFLEWVQTQELRYEFDGVTPGPHGWDVWQKNLIDLAPRLFKR